MVRETTIADSPLYTVTLRTTLGTLADLSRVVRGFERAYVRDSEGPLHDQRPRIDEESGLVLPGLSAIPLHAEPWWTRPLEDWLARQIHRCTGLRDTRPERMVWMLRGVEVAHGPDGETLLRGVVPLARLDEDLLLEASVRYRENFRRVARSLTAGGTGP